VYSKKGDFDKSYFYYSSVLNDYKDDLSISQSSVVLNNMGLMYSAKGDYLKAMEAHQKALYNREQNHDTLGAASSYMNIANIHFYQSDYEKAIEYYKIAVKVYDKHNYSYGSGQCYHNLGTIYEKMDSLKLAELYLKKALKYESAKTSRGRVKTLNMLGLVVMKEGKYSQAEKYFLESLKFNRSINSKVQLIPTLNNLATLYNTMNQPNRAIPYGKEAVKLSKESGSLTLEKDAYSSYARAFELKGDLKNAFKYYKMYSQLKDSLFNSEKHEKIQELEIKYNTVKQENELQRKSAEILKKDLEAKRKDAIIKKEQIQKYSLASIAVLILLILLIELRSMRQKKKSALLLVEKNEELNTQTIDKLIKKHQLESAKNSFEAQEQERNRIAQELHDGIGGSLAAIKLYVDSLRKTHKITELDLVHDNINKTYEEVRTLSHNLTPPEFEFDSITDIVKAYINQISEHSKMEIVLSAVPQTGWNELSENVQINIYRVSQELINNILKHAKASKIEFYLELKDNVISIRVKDNGVGFDTLQKAKGIGLKNIQNRVNDFNGKFEITSVINKGTEVIVEIPDIN